MSQLAGKTVPEHHDEKNVAAARSDEEPAEDYDEIDDGIFVVRPGGNGELEPVVAGAQAEAGSLARVKRSPKKKGRGSSSSSSSSSGGGGKKKKKKGGGGWLRNRGKKGKGE